MKKYCLLILSIMIFLPTIVFAFIYNDTYPYKNAAHCGCESDEWGFYKRQCTSYAAWKVNESGIFMSNGMIGPNGKSGWFGNAGNWDDNARNIGFSVDSNPRVGDIAVWEPNACYGCTVGHLAKVEAVNSDGSVYISEYNWNWGDGNYWERNNVRASSYIHFIGGSTSCGGTNVVISNQTITGPSQCRGSSSIKILPQTQIHSGGGEVRFYIQ